MPDLPISRSASTSNVPAPGAGEPPLVACSLSAGSQRQRFDQWHAVLGAATIEHTANGVVAELPIAAVRDLTALIVAEQECCPFLAFEVAFLGPRLRLTIAAENPGLVADLLPDGSRR